MKTTNATICFLGAGTLFAATLIFPAQAAARYGFAVGSQQ